MPSGAAGLAIMPSLMPASRDSIDRGVWPIRIPGFVHGLDGKHVFRTNVKDTFGYKKQGPIRLQGRHEPVEKRDVRNVPKLQRPARCHPGAEQTKVKEWAGNMDRLGLLIGGVFVAGLGVGMWQFMQPAEQPSGSMTHPEPTELSDVAQGAPIVEVRLPERLSSEAAIGQRAFDSACAACHGANAAGQNGVAPPLIHRTYEPGHHSDEAFQMAVRNGVRAHHWPFGNMPPVEGLTRADVQYIARYIREVQRENGIN